MNRAELREWAERKDSNSQMDNIRAAVRALLDEAGEKDANGERLREDGHALYCSSCKTVVEPGDVVWDWQCADCGGDISVVPASPCPRCAESEDEKRRRIGYQGIVYDALNVTDAALGKSVRKGKGGTCESLVDDIREIVAQLAALKAQVAVKDEALREAANATLGVMRGEWTEEHLTEIKSRGQATLMERVFLKLKSALASTPRVLARVKGWLPDVPEGVNATWALSPMGVGENQPLGVWKEKPVMGGTPVTALLIAGEEGGHE